MATVFMKWLETSPRDYDRGIQLLTLGRLTPLKARLAANYIHPQGGEKPRVLEIGCGTGTLSVMMAEHGAQVTGIDLSASMLAEAECKIKEADLDGFVDLHCMDVTDIGERFEPGNFDDVVSTLAFSEFPPEVIRYVLHDVAQLLKPGGQLLIVDEMIPAGNWARLMYWLVRLPLVILTWLLTRTTTTPLRNFTKTLVDAGFTPTRRESYLGGSLQLVGARPSAAVEQEREQWAAIPELRHRVTAKTLLTDFLSLVNRATPPHPKQATGLYRVGHPDRKSPILVTGNYDLTVRRLVRGLDGIVDCWLVVANSRGINVWCAAGGGHFTADDVISAIKTSGVKEVVDHHAMILPQLCANGVDGWKIRKETGWGVHWGPARASDIPAYLMAGRKKTDTMRRVMFPLKNRMEMVTTYIFIYGVGIVLLSLIFWRPYLWLITGIMLLLSYLYGIFLPWIPGRDGIGKGISLVVLTLAGLWGWSYGWGHLAVESLINWSLGLGFLAFFVGAEFQGISPLMRAEQSNMAIEAPVGLATLVAYFAGRFIFRG
jgi:2-polyprenyl-3-methyl-5-hydroxy-6-metoxy-1,4-benzoquinol methylase